MFLLMPFTLIHRDVWTMILTQSWLLKKGKGFPILVTERWVWSWSQWWWHTVTIRVCSCPM